MSDIKEIKRLQQKVFRLENVINRKTTEIQELAGIIDTRNANYRYTGEWFLVGFLIGAVTGIFIGAFYAWILAMVINEGLVA